MVVGIEIGQVVLARLQDHQNLVVVHELTQILAMLIVVDALDVGIPPNLQTTQRTATMCFQLDAENLVLGQLIASCCPTLDFYLAEILLEDQLLQLLLRLQSHFDNLSLTIAIGREPRHLRLRCTHREVILAVTGHTRHVESLDVGHTRLAVLVGGVIDGARIVLLEHRHMNHLHLALLRLATFRLTNEHLFCHLDDLIRTILVEDDDVVDV